MDRNAYSDSEGADQPDAYWRRRVITLALGLGLLGILAWGFSGGGGKQAGSNPNSVLPAAALGTAIPGLPGSTPTPGVSSSASGSLGAPSTSPGPSAAVSRGATRSASAPSGSPRPAADHAQARPEPRPSSSAVAGSADGRCAPGTVVLSLFTDRASYGPDQFPRFDVYAVSTSSGSCAFDPGQLQVVVLSSGRIVWDSADCAHGSGRAVELTRGVPAQAAVTWDRAITLPGCQVLASSAHAGSYEVQARTATGQSPARPFKITGLSCYMFSSAPGHAGARPAWVPRRRLPPLWDGNRRGRSHSLARFLPLRPRRVQSARVQSARVQSARVQSARVESARVVFFPR